MNEDVILKSIDAKLDTVIKLLSIEATKGRTLTEQVHMLYNLGMSSAEIASCLGKNPNNVRVTLHSIRKKIGGKKVE